MNTNDNTNETSITITELEKQIAAEKAAKASADVESKHSAEVAALQKRIESMEAKMAHENALAEERVSKLQLERAAMEATRSNAKLNTGMDDLKLSQAIKACGGNALWNQLTDKQRANALGIEDSDSVRDAEIKLYFGRTSDSRAAATLAKSSPARYRILRTLAKSRGLY